MRRGVKFWASKDIQVRRVPIHKKIGHFLPIQNVSVWVCPLSLLHSACWRALLWPVGRLRTRSETGK